MRRYGFTEDELERAKTEKLNDLEKAYNERNTRKNIAIAKECIRHFEDGEVMPGIEWEYQAAKAFLPRVNSMTLNQIAALFIHDAPTVAISGPEKKGVNIPNEETIMHALDGMPLLAIEAPKAEVIDSVLVKKAPKAGKIVATKYDDELGTTEWTMQNGVKVVIKPTEFKADEILMQGFSMGGLSQVKTEDLPSAMLATAIIEFMGLGDFSMTQMEKALTGKTVDITPSINENTELISGSSSVKDLETMLQLNYLYFTNPRQDKKAYETLMGILHNSLMNRDKNPKTAFSDSIQLVTSNHSPRTIIGDTNMLKRVTMKKAVKIFCERFANPADFTFVFVGNIDPKDEQTQALICQWLGGMKTKKSREQVIDHHERAPQGEYKCYFSRQMETTTASNRIQYTSYDIPYTMANELNMKMIGRILSTRYLESIREREGGSYGVGTRGGMSILPTSEAVLLMQFDTDPQKQERLMEIIHEEVQTIIANGPLASDLQKEKESMLKDFQENLEKNTYWRQALFTLYYYDVDEVRNYREAVEGITAETVQETLRKLVGSGNVLEVVMFPE